MRREEKMIGNKRAWWKRQNIYYGAEPEEYAGPGQNTNFAVPKFRKEHKLNVQERMHTNI